MPVVNADRSGGFLEGVDTTLLARVTAEDGTAATSSTFSNIDYEVWDITTPGAPTEVTSSTALTVGNVMYDSLQTGDQWNVDTTGYNFEAIIPDSSLPTVAKTTFPNGKFIRIEVKFTTTTTGYIFYCIFEGTMGQVLFDK